VSVADALEAKLGGLRRRLRAHVPWRDAVTACLAPMMNDRMQHALDAEMRFASRA
jgi:hypothetical protein